MKYDHFRFLFPPRPDQEMPAAMLPGKESDHWCQIKKNGTCNVMAISPEREIISMKRNNEKHKDWKPDRRTQQAFTPLPGSWYVFVAELLDGKVPGIRHINYINDLLVADSQYLWGTTFAQRQEMLRQLFPNRKPAEHKSPFGIGYDVIDDHTWLAHNYKPGDNYFELFRSLTDRVDEGVVLKKPDAPLALCSREGSNNTWQLKTRRPTKVLHF